MNRTLLIFFFILFGITANAQFRMVGNGAPTTLTDSTFSITIDFYADLTGMAYFGTQIADTMRVFTGTEQMYTIETVGATEFYKAELIIKEYNGNVGPPVGLVMVYDPDGRETLPQAPFGNYGATSQIQAAVDSYNARLIGSGGVDFTPYATKILLADSTAAVRAAFPQAGHVIYDENVALSYTPILDFTGSGVSVTDSAGLKTKVTINSGGDVTTAQLADSTSAIRAAFPTDDRTRLLQDSILVYSQDGSEVSRDTISGVGGGGSQTLSFVSPNLSISDGNSVDLSAIDTDTQLDSAGIAALGYVAGAHTIDTDTQLDSTGVAALGYVAGAHTVDTQIDSVGISALGYVAGAHTVDTQIDSAGVAAFGYVAGAHTVDTQIDSAGIAVLGYVAGAHTVDTQIDSAGVAAFGYIAGADVTTAQLADTSAAIRADFPTPGTPNFYIVDNVAAIANGSYDPGDVILTKGYATAGDGGSARYVVKADSIALFTSDYIFQIPVSGGYAHLQIDDIISVLQVGAIPGDNLSDQASVDAVINYLNGTSNSGTTVYFPLGDYDSLSINIQKIQIRGAGEGTVLKGDTVLHHATQANRPTNTRYQHSDFRIEAQQVAVYDVYGGNHWDNVHFNYLERGYVQHGAIYNRFENCRFDGQVFGDGTTGKFGWYSTDKETSPGSGTYGQSGSTSFYACRFTANDTAAVYFDNSRTNFGGEVFIENSFFEGNKGFGVFVADMGADDFSGPFVVYGCHFELNHTASSVEIDGTTYSGAWVVDLYANNATPFISEKNAGHTINIQGNTLYHSIDEWINDGFVQSTEAAIIFDNHFKSSNEAAVPNLSTSVKTNALELNNNSSVYKTLPPTSFSTGYQDNLLLTLNFMDNEDYPMQYISTAPWDTATAVKDGLIGDYSVEIARDAVTRKMFSNSTFTPSASKYIVWGVVAKKESGTTNTLQFDNGQNLGTIRLADEWGYYIAIGKSDSDGVNTNRLTLPTGTGVVRIQAAQVLEFDSFQEAYDFLQQRVLVVDTSGYITHDKLKVENLYSSTDTYDASWSGNTTVPIKGDIYTKIETMPNVTLTGSYDYATLSNQQITLNQIDANTDITGTLDGLTMTNPFGGTNTVSAFADSTLANAGGGGSGLTSLNSLTNSVQVFATGTTGTDFNISSATSTHTFNLPDASATARGLITTGAQTIAGVKTFSGDLELNADLLDINNSTGTAGEVLSSLGGTDAGIDWVGAASLSITNPFSGTNTLGAFTDSTYANSDFRLVLKGNNSVLDTLGKGANYSSLDFNNGRGINTVISGTDPGDNAYNGEVTFNLNASTNYYEDTNVNMLNSFFDDYSRWQMHFRVTNAAVADHTLTIQSPNGLAIHNEITVAIGDANNTYDAIISFSDSVMVADTVAKTYLPVDGEVVQFTVGNYNGTYRWYLSGTTKAGSDASNTIIEVDGVAQSTGNPTINFNSDFVTATETPDDDFEIKIASPIADIIEGMSRDKPTLDIVNTAGTLYLEVEKDGGGDIEVFLNGQVATLDCTTGAGTGGKARVALTAGTNANTPQVNYFYITASGSTATLNASTGIPSGAFVWVGKAVVPDVTTWDTEGNYLLQRTTESLNDSRGQLSHAREKLRFGLDGYHSGATPTFSIDATQDPDTMSLTTLSGIIYQMHKQTWPAFDNSKFYYGNGQNIYESFTDLNQALATSDGTPLSNNDRYSLVIWGAMNYSDADCKVFVNLSSDTYASDALADADANNTADYSVPNEFRSVAFLIARVVLKYTTSSSGTFTEISFYDLTGQKPGGRNGGSSVVPPTIATDFLDGEFKLLNSADITKEAAFSAAGISTGQTRTFTFPDANGTLALTSDLHTAITLAASATTGGLGLTTQEISFQAATAGQNGYLTSTDWTTFNNKISAETNNLSGAVTWVTVPDAYISASSVNQHVSDLIYGIGWDSNTSAASKNAIYDKIESINDHASVTLGAGNSSAFALSGQELTLTESTLEANLAVDDLKTLSGVAGGSVNLGTFTGSTITDNQTIKSALQELETAVEGVGGGHDAVTLAASATTGGLSLTTQEIGFQAATGAQNGYLTSTDWTTFNNKVSSEINDLSAIVTWANVPDANITVSSVTQHQASLSITESQISDLGSYAVIGGTPVDNRIAVWSDATTVSHDANFTWDGNRMVFGNAKAIATTTTDAHALLIQGYDTDLPGYINVATVTNGTTPVLNLSNTTTVNGNAVAYSGGAFHNSFSDYDVAQHRTINDGSTATTALWSASKINTELAGKAATSHTHAASDVTSGSFADAFVDDDITLTNITQITNRAVTNTTATNWRVFYSNGTGNVTELALGASGTVLQSNGASAAPTFETVTASGDNLGNHTATEDLDLAGFNMLNVDTISNGGSGQLTFMAVNGGYKVYDTNVTAEHLTIANNSDSQHDHIIQVSYNGITVETESLKGMIFKGGRTNNGSYHFLNRSNNLINFQVFEKGYLRAKQYGDGNREAGDNAGGTEPDFSGISNSDYFAHWSTTGELLELSSGSAQGILSVDDLITLSGVAEGAVNLGTFTGTTITDNVVIKTALQELETAVEAAGGGGATQLSELSDVNTSAPTNLNVLVADGVDWESRALATTDIQSGTFADERIAQSNVTQHQAAINHNVLFGYDANEHIDWTGAGSNFKTNGTGVFSGTNGDAVQLQVKANISQSLNVFEVTDAFAIDKFTIDETGTVGTGIWQGTAIADAYVANDITLTNITQITNRAITNTTANNWQVFYSNGSGVVSEIALGADGTVLTSTGANTAPQFEAAAGGGNVSNTGTPLNNQLAVWTDATTVEGDANLTWDGTTLATGAGTGITINGTSVLDRSTHTGTQALSTISDVTATAAEVNLLDLAGLTAGHVLRAATATTAAWAQLNTSDLNNDSGFLTAEVDGSDSNEGSLTVGAGTATTSLIQSNTSGSTDVTLTAGTNITLSESGNNITIAATGSGGISNVVEDTSPQLGGMLDVNNYSIGNGTEELITFTEIVSAVNEIVVRNAATGNAPRIGVSGGDTNVDLELAPKGTATIKLTGYGLGSKEASDQSRTPSVYMVGLATDGSLIEHTYAVKSSSPANSATVDSDYNNTPFGKHFMNMTSVTSGITLTFTDFVNGGDYLVIFTNVSGTDTITLPSNCYYLDGDGTTVSSIDITQNTYFYITKNGTNYYIQ